MDTLWGKKDRPLVTGVTLVYNQLPFAQSAIESMIGNHGLDQEEFDYHLWDNGSPYPGVAQYLAGFLKSDWPKLDGPGFNVGVGQALNWVLENTDSEYFLKYDDDCMMLPWTLPLMVLAYSVARAYGFPLGILSADVIGVGKAEGPFYEVEVCPGLTLECNWCVGAGCILIARDVLEDAGPFRADRLYGVEDGDMGLRLTNKGYFNAYLKGVYHVSRCRSEEADPQIDAWKLEYYTGKTDLDFASWKGDE